MKSRLLILTLLLCLCLSGALCQEAPAPMDYESFCRLLIAMDVYPPADLEEAIQYPELIHEEEVSSPDDGVLLPGDPDGRWSAMTDEGVLLNLRYVRGEEGRMFRWQAALDIHSMDLLFDRDSGDLLSCDYYCRMPEGQMQRLTWTADDPTACTLATLEEAWSEAVPTEAYPYPSWMPVPAGDYEGFHQQLQKKGIDLPATWAEACAEEDWIAEELMSGALHGTILPGDSYTDYDVDLPNGVKLNIRDYDDGEFNGSCWGASCGIHGFDLEYDARTGELLWLVYYCRLPEDDTLMVVFYPGITDSFLADIISPEGEYTDVTDSMSFAHPSWME